MFQTELLHLIRGRVFNGLSQRAKETLKNELGVKEYAEVEKWGAKVQNEGFDNLMDNLQTRRRENLELLSAIFKGELSGAGNRGNHEACITPSPNPEVFKFSTNIKRR